MMNMQGYQAAAMGSATVRQISDLEKQTLARVLWPMKMNAIGIALVAMLMAVMVNFVSDQWMIVLPLVFGFISLGMAVQARKMAGKIAGALARGNVVDLRATMVHKNPGGGWSFGAISVPRDSMLNSLLQEGGIATATIMPESKHLLSVNNTPLRKPILYTALPGYEGIIAPIPAAQAYQQPHTTMPLVQNVPPPPPAGASSDKNFCSRCGHGLPGGASFCSNCGFRFRT